MEDGWLIQPARFRRWRKGPRDGQRRPAAVASELFGKFCYAHPKTLDRIYNEHCKSVKP